MKSAIFCLALAATLMLSAVPALAQDNEAASSAESASSADNASDVLRTSKQANLRSLPDTDSDLLEKLDKYAQVQVISTLGEGENTWAYVKTVKGGRTGYILLNLLEPVPTPSPTPVPTPKPGTKATPIQESQVGGGTQYGDIFEVWFDGADAFARAYADPHARARHRQR